MGQNASKGKHEFSKEESQSLTRLATEIRTRTEADFETIPTIADVEKIQRKDSGFIKMRNIREGNKALDFLGEYHLLNAMNKEGISNLNTNLFLGLNADSFPASNESWLKDQEEASHMFASEYDSNLIQSTTAHTMKKKMIRAVANSKNTAVLLDGVFEEQSKNPFKKFTNILQHSSSNNNGKSAATENQENQPIRQSYFKETCRKCSDDDCVHVLRESSKFNILQETNSRIDKREGAKSRNSKKFSQGQLNPKILEEIEKMKASIQRTPQSITTIKEDKNPSKASIDVEEESSNENKYNEQSVYHLAEQNNRFTFNNKNGNSSNNNVKSATLENRDSESSQRNKRKLKLKLKVSNEPQIDPRLCEKVVKRDQVPVVYANLVNQRYTKRSRSPEKKPKSASEIRPVSPASQTRTQNPTLHTSFLNKTHDIAVSKSEAVIYPTKYTNYLDNYTQNHPSLHLDSGLGNRSPNAYQAQASKSQNDLYSGQRHHTPNKTQPHSQNELYSRKVEYSPSPNPSTPKNRSDPYNQKHVQYVPYVNPSSGLSPGYYNPQSRRGTFDFQNQPNQSQADFYSRKTEYISPVNLSIQPGVYKNLERSTTKSQYGSQYGDPIQRFTGRDSQGQGGYFVRTQPLHQDFYISANYTLPVNRSTHYENISYEESHRRWPNLHTDSAKEFVPPVPVQKAVGLGSSRNYY